MPPVFDMRTFFIFLVGFTSCASFTSPSTLDIQYRFPYYMGDLETLSKIEAISGTVAKYFPTDANCLDDILGEEHLYHMCLALYESDLSGLGKLISELSPGRFDSLCFKLDRSDYSQMVWSLADGYENEKSRWKQALKLKRQNVINAENAPFYPFGTDALCDLMEGTPQDILTVIGKNYCARKWLGERKYDLLRRWILESSDGQYLEYDVFLAFAEHQQELVNWLKFALQNDYFMTNFRLSLPDVLSEEYLIQLYRFIGSQQCKCAPEFFISFFRDERRKEVINSINQLVRWKDRVIPYQINVHGFDHEPFMGEWPIARRVHPRIQSLHRTFFQLQRGHPQSLQEAFQLAYDFGHMEPLENTLLLLRFLDDKADIKINEHFWEWFGELISFSGFQPKLPQFRQIFSLLKPHLTDNFEEVDVDDSWHRVDLYEDMMASPSSYFSPKQESEAIKWVKSALRSLPQDPKVVEEASQGGWNAAIFPYSLHQGWLETARRGFEAYKKGDYLDHELFRQMAHLFSTIELRGMLADRFILTLRDSLGWIAMTSNFNLLDDFLQMYTPHFIFSACRDYAHQRRISLMMHLSPITKSYKLNGEPVDKNSVFFRDWIMYRLPGKHKADLKLLDYYFHNRFHGRYPGFDLLSGDRVFGLLGNANLPGDPMRAGELAFEYDERAVGVVWGYAMVEENSVDSPVLEDELHVVNERFENDDEEDEKTEQDLHSEAELDLQPEPKPSRVEPEVTLQETAPLTWEFPVEEEFYDINSWLH